MVAHATTSLHQFLSHPDILWLQGEFVDDGTETHFSLSDRHAAYIKATSSGKKKTGIVHALWVNDSCIPEATEWNKGTVSYYGIV